MEKIHTYTIHGIDGNIFLSEIWYTINPSALFCFVLRDAGVFKEDKFVIDVTKENAISSKDLLTMCECRRSHTYAYLIGMNINISYSLVIESNFMMHTHLVIVRSGTIGLFWLLYLL